MNPRVPITVSGNILSELSEKIPNNIIALNELIKNSYDAKATEVKIILDTDNSTLTLIDDGIGMDTEDIKKLFHISSSEKKYGIDTGYEGRLLQGSKGLGFLSVFKFGRNVTWKTYKNGGISEFSVEFDSLIKEYNLTDKTIDIREVQDDNFSGTTIVIQIDEYNIESLKNYFSVEMNRLKILNSFIKDRSRNDSVDITIDKSFSIQIVIDNEKFETDKSMDLATQNSSQQLFRIKYNSDKEDLDFYKEDILLFTEKIPFSSERYTLSIDLMSYSLKSRGKEKINSLFYNINTNELTPLLFVNQNIFNNYTIFNTEIMTVKKYSDIFKQLIGFISIKSDDSELEFNSDRSQFSQNSLTDDILKFIEKLNLKIQSIGSSLRKEIKYIDAFEKKSIDEEILDAFLTDNNFLNYIKPNFKLKQFLMPKLNNEKKIVEMWLFDNYISLEILQKEKEVKLMGSIEAWLDFGTLDEQVEGFCELIHSATQFKVDGTTVEEFYQQEGNWEIIKESPNSVEKTILNLKTVQPPKIQCVQNTVEMGRDHSLDELFKVWNSFNEEDKDIKFELDTEGNNTIHFNSSEGKVNFGRSGEQKIIIKITDKKTNLVHQSDFIFRVIQKAYEIPSASKENDKFIKSPINVKPNYNPDIIHFIDELNSVFQDGNYNTIPVVSYRALVEIVVRDILSNLGIAKDESLLKNYSKVIEKSESIIDSSSLDADDKRTLGTLLTSLQSQVEKEAFLAFLNLSTHGGPRIITKTEALAKAKEIKFLIGILYITHCK